MNLLEIIKKHCKAEKRHILLIGEGGMGKSTSLIQTMKMLLMVENFIPMYIPLYMYNGEKNFIKNYIVNKYLGNVLNNADDSSIYEKIKKIFFESTNKKFIFLLDGINETPNARVGGLFSEINELNEYENVFLVITSRYDISELDKSFCRYLLKGLSTEKIHKVVSVENCGKNKIFNFLKIPFYLIMYKKISYKRKVNIKSSAEFLATFYEHQLNKLNDAQTKVYDNMYYDFCKIVIFEYLPFFSHLVCRSGKVLFRQDISEKSWHEWINNYATDKQKYIINNCNKYYYLNVLVNFGIVTSIDDYYKAHQIVSEFFAAVYIKNCENTIEYDITICETTNKNVMENYGQLIGEQLVNISDSKLLSKLNKNRGAFEGGIVPLFNSRLLEFAKCFHKKISYDLSYLDLRDVEISGVNFSEANFEGAILECNVFCESGHRDTPCNAILSPNGKILITLDRERLVVWEDSICLTHIDNDKYVAFLAFLDNNTLLIGTDEEWGYDEDGDIEITTNRHIWSINVNNLINVSNGAVWSEEITIKAEGNLLSMSKNGKYILVDDGICELRDNTYCLIKPIQCGYHSYEHYDEKYEISNDGTTILYQNGDGVYIYETAADDWVCVKQFKKFEEQFNEYILIDNNIVQVDDYNYITIYDFKGAKERNELSRDLKRLFKELYIWNFKPEKIIISILDKQLSLVAIEQQFKGTGRIALLGERSGKKYCRKIYSQISSSEGINISSDGKYAEIYMLNGGNQHTILFDILKQKVIDNKINGFGTRWKLFQDNNTYFDAHDIIWLETNDSNCKTDKYLFKRANDIIYVYNLSSGELLLDTENIMPILNIVGANFANIKGCIDLEHVKVVITKNGGNV